MRPTNTCILLAPSPLQEAALEEFLGNLTQALQLPAGALSLDSLQAAAPSTSDLAVSEAQAQEQAHRLARLLLAEAQLQQGAGGKAGQPKDGAAAATAKEQQAAAAKQQGSPMYLTATVSLGPDSAAESGDGQFSAAWIEAALGQVAAEQPADDPVQLGINHQVSRWAGGGQRGCAAAYCSAVLALALLQAGVGPAPSPAVPTCLAPIPCHRCCSQVWRVRQ